MLEYKRGQVKLEDISVVKEFPYVFPEELPGLPPEREVDLSIEILPGDGSYLQGTLSDGSN